MNYLELIKSSQSSGQWNEKTMWKSVEHISELLKTLKEETPDVYWSFMRKEAGLLSGYHYTEMWANHDVSKIEWTDVEGRKHTGAYWTAEQVEEAMKEMSFPSGVTKWDKYVAANIAYSDMCKVLDEEHILKVAYAFFFKDEDWDEDGRGLSTTKVWQYMCCKNQK